MSEVLHANIFFLIASIATVVFSITLCFILYQVFKIVKLVRSILERVEAASEVVAEDMANVRSFIARGGIVSRVFGLILGEKKKRGRTRRKAHTSD